MKFSEAFSVDRKDDDDWFDPILNVDSKLFIDPFLIYSQPITFFEDAHSEIITIFNKAYTLISRVAGDTSHNSWKKASHILLFPEAKEFCIGYATANQSGSGTGKGFSKLMCEAIWESIEAGIQEVTHFEEIGILREGIGADRISDITASILKHRFIKYTETICERHKIPTKELRYDHGIYNDQYTRWMPLKAKLPRNPCTGVPVILTPERFLRDLPTISSDTFWGYCRENENDQIRTDFNVDISQGVKKSDIIQFAREHPRIRQKYIRAMEKKKPDPYNLTRDKNGIVGWYKASKDYCEQSPVSIHFNNEDEFIKTINDLLLEFRNYVENNGGWKLLWNENFSPKREEASQFLMQGIIKFWCRANNIDLSREVDIGRGPVDFKVSQGHEFRALLELKLAKNTRFWDGLTKQLPKYMEAESVSIGYFIAVLKSENDLKRMKDIQAKVEEVNQATGYQISSFFIDASREKPSASKL